MDERILAQKAREGDKDAFAKLYALYSDKFYRYAYFKLGNEQDAMDAVSDCVLEAFKYIKTLKKAEAFASWVFKILYRCCSRKIEEQALRRSETEICESSASYTEDFKSAELKEALGLLTAEERDIVLLSSVAGYTSREISSLLKIKPTTVRSKLSRSLSKMREFLE